MAPNRGIRNNVHRHQRAPSKPTPPPKKAPAKPPAKPPTPTSPLNQLPLEVQQLVSNIFSNTFPLLFTPDLPSLVQQVKNCLYNRDFNAAFGQDQFLEAYAVRWSVARALGYLQIFHEVVEPYLNGEDRGREEDGVKGRRKLEVVCLGGGAGAELVGLAGWARILQQRRESQTGTDTMDDTSNWWEQGGIETICLDIADWSSILARLQTSITNPPPLSKYASAALKATNTPLADGEKFSTSFHKLDLLNIDKATLQEQCGGADLITLMFTLNELYSSSIASTQRFLWNLAEVLRPGALLLVGDSPGSYSSVELNGKEKKYPLHWLLDHTLLTDSGEDLKSSKEGGSWEKLVSDESRWSRVPEGLKYPIELENMRYQIHLYRRS